MIENKQKYELPTALADFDAELRLSINGGKHKVKIIDISESSLSILMDERLNTIIPEAMTLNDVEIFMNNKHWGTINIVINEKMRLNKMEENVFLNIADAIDKKSAYKLWEIMYYMSPQAGTPQVVLDRENIPRVPGRGLYTEKASIERLEYIREKTAVSLEGIGATLLDPQKL